MLFKIEKCYPAQASGPGLLTQTVHTHGANCIKSCVHSGAENRKHAYSLFVRFIEPSVHLFPHTSQSS